MSRIVTVFFALAVASSSAHAATRRCPPIAAGQGQQCECLVLNYGDKTITVGIRLIGTSQGNVDCGERTLSSEQSANCSTTITGLFARCGCEVTGASGATRVTLVVTGAGVSAGAEAAVPCP